MSLHILYEVEALADIKRTLFFDGRYDERDFPAGSIRRARGNGLLEAFVMHMRCLDDFLYKDQVALKGKTVAAAPPGEPVGVLKIDGDCVIALDFVRDPQDWIDMRPPRPSVIDKARRQTNQHLIHLDWRRIDSQAVLAADAYEKGQTWPIEELFDAIAPAIEAFAGHVSQELVVAGFCERLLAVRPRSHPGPGDFAELKAAT